MSESRSKSASSGFLSRLPQTLQTARPWYIDKLTRASQEGPEGYDEGLKWLGRHDLFFLIAVILAREDINRPWLFDRCREVQGSPDGFLDLWAREHYKSTIITFGLTIQEIINDPEVTIGIFSHTKQIARGFLRQIKREFESNELLKSLYPEILYNEPAKESPKWSEDEGVIVKRLGNPKEATIEGWGLVDGQPTSKHFRIRVYDDVVTKESVTTPEQVNKTTTAWEMSDNLGAMGGRVRYIGTRYHLRDTYATMIERGVVRERIYPATSNGRLDGKPVLLTDAQWAEKKKTQRSTLAAQMLQNPLADTDATFRVEWLRPYEVRPRTMNILIMADPSKGRSATSDNTAIAVIGIAAGGTRYLVDGYCHRMSLSQRWVALRDLYKRWSIMPGVQQVAVGYERYGAQSDDEYFKEQMLREKVHFTIRELNWTRDGSESKRDRVERLEPDFRLGRFYLPVTVWRESSPSVWSIDDDVESKTYQSVMWRESQGFTAPQKLAFDGGSTDLISKAIKRVDEERRVYDLTLRFMQEYEQFPFGLHDDLLDATSRIYDMESRAPMIVSRADTEPPQFFDS